MNDKNIVNEPWLSTKDIANHLGVTVETIRKWIKVEKIPCHRVGKLWKFKVNEIDAWVINGQASNDEKHCFLSDDKWREI